MLVAGALGFLFPTICSFFLYQTILYMKINKHFTFVKEYFAFWGLDGLSCWFYRKFIRHQLMSGILILLFMIGPVTFHAYTTSLTFPLSSLAPADADASFLDKLIISTHSQLLIKTSSPIRWIPWTVRLCSWTLARVDIPAGIGNQLQSVIITSYNRVGLLPAITEWDYYQLQSGIITSYRVGFAATISNSYCKSPCTTSPTPSSAQCEELHDGNSSGYRAHPTWYRRVHPLAGGALHEDTETLRFREGATLWTSRLKMHSLCYGLSAIIPEN